MTQDSMTIRYNLGRLVLVFLGLVAVVAYGTISFAAHDLIWFMPGFTERPARIVVYKSGAQTVFTPGQRGYDELAAAIVDSLNQGVARQSGLGLSEASLQDAYHSYLTVEAFWTEPVKIHAWFDTHQPTQMLFPITGRHSETNVVFLGENGVYMSNSPALKTTQPISSVLASMGF